MQDRIYWGGGGGGDRVDLPYVLVFVCSDFLSHTPCVILLIPSPPLPHIAILHIVVPNSESIKVYLYSQVAL